MTKLYEAKPYIIAEVGSNWQSFDDCKDSVQMAKQCGANAVKFQAFNYNALYGFGGAETENGKGFGDGNNSLRATLPHDWLPKLADKARAAGIEFLCTAFSPELVDVVDPFVPVHKIASSDLSYVELLERVAAKKKPILLSVGASSKGDIALALEVLDGADVVLMYCNSAYPSRHHNLFDMHALSRDFGRPVGLSDHSRDVVYCPLSAFKHFGAVAIEKHFSIIEADTPDRGHSLDVAEFKIMVDHLRGRVPDTGHMPTAEEKAMFLRHNRRLIATKDIRAGDVLRYGGNFGAYRSLKDDTYGMTPFILRSKEHTPDGKPAKNEIKAGDSIGPGDW